jgi:branched-chain amino acid transport system ATP-binding protein
MLTVESLRVRYGRVTAVRDVSLHVNDGELVSLVGSNGAGKSSTLLAIAGAIAPAAGTITLDGETISGRSPEAVARAGLSFVPEGRDVFAQLTVEENLRLGATRRGKDPGIEEDIERGLERFPVLRRYFRSNAGRLSGGEQQQLVIARALLSKPRLLLLDEPSLGLAPQMVELVLTVVDELRAAGTTILLVEQLAEQAVELADRSYVLRNGEVVASGTASELASQIDLESAYLGAAGGPA